jgi:hypothetical protein
VSGHGANARGGTVVMALVDGASSSHGVVTIGLGGAHMPCLWETGRLKLPSLLEAVELLSGVLDHGPQ